MLSITVLNYNDNGLLTPCLESINKALLPKDHERLVLDNGSDVIPKVPDGWKVHHLEKNRGITGGLNACFENAKYDWVLFIANDVRIFPDTVLRMFEVKDKTKRVMPIIFTKEGSIDSAGFDLKWPLYGFSRHRSNDLTPPVSIPNIIFLMHKDLWRSVGRFDENIGLGYDDVDFDLRTGTYQICAKKARATHLGSSTYSKTDKDHQQKYHKSRSYVIKKNFPTPEANRRLIAEGIIYACTRLAHKLLHK